MFKILFLGDIVGKPGRRAVSEHLVSLKEELQPNLVIANGENAAGGVGIEAKLAEEIFHYGVDVITTGNHIWKRKEIFPYLETNAHRIIRPGNYPAGAPGKGFCIIEKEGLKIAIVNAQGRVFMAELVDCPFRYLDKLLQNELQGCDLIFHDFHCGYMSFLFTCQQCLSTLEVSGKNYQQQQNLHEQQTESLVTLHPYRNEQLELH